MNHVHTILDKARERGEDAVAVVGDLVDKVQDCPIQRDRQAYLIKLIRRGDIRGFNLEFIQDCNEAWRPAA